MKTIALIGQNGFIGKNVLRYLKQFYSVSDHGPCDVLVNCAGFARMYEASRNPELMQRVEESVFERIKQIPFKHLIHISTIYIEANPKDNYSKFKQQMEEWIKVQYHDKDLSILRTTSVLGPGLKKNVIYDLIHGYPLWVTPESVYNYISTQAIAEIIQHLIENPVLGTFNVGASESIQVSEIAKLLKRTPIYGSKTDTVRMDVSKLQSFYEVKTSAEYIEDFWKGQACGYVQ